MAIRLVKLAKELNLSTKTIVEKLLEHGHSIENKPTQKITNEQYLILKNSLSKTGLEVFSNKLREEVNSKNNYNAEFEPETFKELSDEYNITFTQFLVLSKDINFDNPVS